MGRPRNTLEKVLDQLYKTHENKIVLLEFYGLSEDGKFQCKLCGHVWWNKAKITVNKTGCPNCQRLNDKLSDEYVRNFIEEQGCRWIDGIYDNAHSKLFIEFECGHTNWIVYNSFQRGRRCYSCGRQKIYNSNRTKEDDIVLFIEEHGFQFIDFPDGFITQKKSTVRYSCNKGHITERQCGNLFQNPTCNTCEFEDLRKLHVGKNNNWWKGGITALRNFCFNQISDWKEESKINCNYTCVITGKKMEEVHHIYPFGKIIYETLENLGLQVEENICNYTYDEMNKISFEIRRLHSIYPLGVCVTKKVHALFHKIYGRGDTNPEQWYDFIKNIRLGKIIIE